MQRPEKSVFDPPRRAPRFVPKKSLTAAVLGEGAPVSFGVVADISAGGVCVQSVEFSMSRSFELMLSFDGGDMLEATVQVVWAKPISGAVGHAAYGLEFTEISDDNKNRLVAALESSSFVPSDA